MYYFGEVERADGIFRLSENGRDFRYWNISTISISNPLYNGLEIMAWVNAVREQFPTVTHIVETRVPRERYSKGSKEPWPYRMAMITKSRAYVVIDDDSPLDKWVIRHITAFNGL